MILVVPLNPVPEMYTRVPPWIDPIRGNMLVITGDAGVIAVVGGAATKLAIAFAFATVFVTVTIKLPVNAVLLFALIVKSFRTLNSIGVALIVLFEIDVVVCATVTNIVDINPDPIIGKLVPFVMDGAFAKLVLVVRGVVIVEPDPTITIIGTVATYVKTIVLDFPAFCVVRLTFTFSNIVACGAVTIISVSEMNVNGAVLDPNRTLVVPVNATPVIVTGVLDGPDVGDMEIIVGAVVYVNVPVPVPTEVVTLTVTCPAPAGIGVVKSSLSEIRSNDNDVDPNITLVTPENPNPEMVSCNPPSIGPCGGKTVMADGVVSV